MGGRGYHNDVVGYLRSDKRTSEYDKISAISTKNVDFIIDKTTPTKPSIPEFSNSPNKIYVLLNKSQTKIKSITVYDCNHEQDFSIHLDHYHKGSKDVHVHAGFNRGRIDLPLLDEHKRLIRDVQDIFERWKSKQWKN